MWLELLKSILINDFGEKLKNTISNMGITIKEFSEKSGVPEGTIYKIISDEDRDFRKSTLISIINYIKAFEGYISNNIIGIITTREALDTIGKEVKIGKRSFIVKEFPATTIEEEIIKGIRAEKEGVNGLICGPIAATTLEKIVDIPIAALRFEEGPLMNSINNLVKKI